MIAIIGNPERSEIRTLRGSLLLSGYPAAVVTQNDPEILPVSLAVVVFAGDGAPETVDPERIVVADSAALNSRDPGVSVFEAERVRERADEVLAIKSGVRFDNCVSNLYTERNGVSVFLGERIPLTGRERLIVRLLSSYPGRFLSARLIALSCFPEPAKDGAVRSAVYEINRRTKELTGFPMIRTRPAAGYSLAV